MTRSFVRIGLALACILLAPASSTAQQGTVNYTVTLQLEMDLDLPPEVAHMRDQIPTESSSEIVLLFDENETLTRGVDASTPPSIPDPGAMPSEGGNVQVVVRSIGSGTEDATHVDLRTGETVQQREFLGRTFRIKGEVEPLAWRLTGEQSEFLGFPCQKAIATRDTTEIEAWFTTEIPVSAGPEQYGGLPGLILVLTSGRRTFEATAVDLSPLAPEAIQVPREGREATSEQFAQIMEERLEDLETTGLPNRRGSFRVIRRGN